MSLLLIYLLLLTKYKPYKSKDCHKFEKLMLKVVVVTLILALLMI